jgi:hypothetical protein
MQSRAIAIDRQKLIFGAMLSAAAALAAVLAIGGKTEAVGGPTCVVPSADHATIQSAVSDTDCSTVKVKAGTYNEHVVISRSLTLKGAKAGNPVSSRTFADSHESTIDGSGASDTPTVTINAPDVTINGFSITNPAHGLGVTVKTAGNNAVIKKNIVNTVGSNAYTQPTVGVYLENGPDSVQLRGNEVNNVQSNGGSAQGVLIGDSTSSNPSLNTLIDGNVISNVASVLKGAYGVQANNGASSSPTATGYTELKVRGNNIKNLSGNWAHGVGLEGETPNAVVRFNTISNLTDTSSSPINDAVGVVFEDNPFFFTAKVNRNNLAVGSNAYGIAVNPALTNQYSSLSVDGECNWWGASNGPGSVGSGSGSMVSAGVDFQPWLKSANLNGRCGDQKNNDHDQHDGDCDEHGWDDKRGDWNKHDD